MARAPRLYRYRPPVRPTAVVRPDLTGRRVIAVSDIHGNLSFLKALLCKVGFCREDALVLVGDLLEKGTDSLGVLRYVMELQRDHVVYPLCGNCDDIDRDLLLGEPWVYEVVWPIVQNWGGRMLLLQLAAELGLAMPDSPQDLPALREALLEAYPQECAFVLALPHILESGNYLFVHGGVPREDHLEELDAFECMKNDDFLGQGLSFEKWVVVGHWPVTLYRADIPSAAPIVLHSRHIVSIDGGCVLKKDGQLNALIIPDIHSDQMSWTSYDGLPQVTALDSQAASPDPVNIRWSDSRVEVLREDGDCAWCRHLSTGRELWIPRSYLEIRRDGELHTEDITDYLPPVEPGDVLSLVLTCDRGHLVKKDGASGWYLGRVAPAR